MNIDNVKIITHDLIQTLSIPSTEEINSKSLKEFIKTNLTEHSIDISKNTSVYFKYLYSSKSYEVLYFEANDNDSILLEPFILKSYYQEHHNKNSIDLFLTNNYFVLFQNQELLLFKNIQNSNKEDIELYISQNYLIDIDQTFIIDHDTLQHLQKQPIKNQTKLHKLYQDNSFFFFQIFLLICLSIFSYIVYEKVNNTKPNKVVKNDILEKKYKHLKSVYDKHHTKSIDIMSELFKYLKIHSIYIDTISYKNNQIQTTLYHKDKTKLLDFISIYSKNLDINSISFDESKKEYQMSIRLKI